MEYGISQDKGETAHFYSSLSHLFLKILKKNPVKVSQHEALGTGDHVTVGKLKELIHTSKTP